jgi:hypothetical protein
MSHFTVLIISNPGEDPEKFLEPFQENNNGDCPSEYMEFVDRTDGLKEKYEAENEATKEKYPTLDKYATEYN